MYDFHWSNAKYMNPSRANVPFIRPHQCDSDGGHIRGVLLYAYTHCVETGNLHGISADFLYECSLACNTITHVE